jgi:hypothetical protein
MMKNRKAVIKIHEFVVRIYVILTIGQPLADSLIVLR